MWLVIGLLLWLLLTTGTIIILLIILACWTIWRYKVPFVSTPRDNVNLIINLFQLKLGQKFYDLGCGDGRFLIAAANQGAIAVGFEVAWWAILRGRLNLWRQHSSAKISHRNFLKANIANADAVYCFLNAILMPKVEAKLKQELKPGAKFICFSPPLPTWQPDQIIQSASGTKTTSKIYVYTKK